LDRAAASDGVRRIIATVLELDESDVKEESLFVEELDADSLDLLSLVVSLRDEFGISVSDGEVKELLVELARFLPDTALTEDSSDEDFAEATRRLTVGTVVDFVFDRTSERV
jgi:acyl carrier protein